jgi:ribosomal protein S18 acetylase RimI-like enzyme
VLPPIGGRVSVRYRESGGGHTDVIGYLVAVSPRIVVRSSANLVEIDPLEVVAVRELSHVPVRASQIRALEHAAALAWPGTEQHWHRGWLLRAAGGHTSRANSAVPLDFSSSIADLPGIIDWYTQRALTPWLALPERLLPIRAEGVKANRVMVRDLDAALPGDEAVLLDRPDPAWLARYQRDVPVEVLTAVIDGAVVFASVGDAVGRGAVTTAPDGVRWLGISAVHVAAAQRRLGLGRAVCEALWNWGLRQGAQRAYVQVLADNDAAVALYTSLGFGLHHRARYLDARRLVAL